MIDTHAHLFKSNYKENFEEVYKQATDNLDYVINVGWSVETSKHTIELSEQYEKLLPTVGIHPNDTADATEEDLKEIEAMLQNPKVVALGEIGLDYFREGYNKEKQHDFFVRQLELAREYDFPVIVHTRSEQAVKEAIEVLMNYKDLQVVVHSWTGNVEQTKQILEETNFLFSYNGIATFKNAPEIRETLEITPLDRFILETDAPWLSPEPLRGKTNTPANVEHVYRYVAEFKGIDFEAFEKQMDNNAKAFYRIK